MAGPPQAENLEPLPENVARMLACARAGRDEDLEAAWMAALEGGTVEVDHLRMVLEQVAAHSNRKLLESLLWLLVTLTTEGQGAEIALDVIWRAKDLLPDADTLRDEIGGLYRSASASVAGIDTLVAMTVGRRDIPLKEALPLLERLLKLPPGTFVSDARRKSPGCITGSDAARKVLVVSFGESERAYDALALDALDVLEADDFRALAIFDKPRLEVLAKDDPALLVRLVLKVHGPRLNLKDLKTRLAGVAVSTSGWSKWWAGAKAAVKRHPLIDMSEGTQPDFLLRQRAISYEEEARDKYASAPSLEDRLLLVLGHLDETGHDPATEEKLLRSFALDLAAPTGAASPVAVLESLAVLAELRRRTGYADLPGLPPDLKIHLEEQADLGPLVASIRNDPLALLTLVLVRETLAERWPEVFAAALPQASQEVADQIAADLSSAGRSDLLSGAAGAVMRQPLACVAALVWLWKSAGAGRYPEALADLSRPSITVRLFQAVNDLALTPTSDKPRQQDLLWQVRRAVAAKEFALLRDLLDHTDAGWAKEIRTAVSRNSGLTDHLRVQVLEVLGHAHPVPIAKTLMPWEEDLVYTTPAALEQRRKQYEELTTVKMIEIANRIGVALGHGDISENSEFTAAMEERDRMTERATAMQTDLVKARPVTTSMASGDFVNVGTRVTARRLSTGQVETLTFLGPWDARTEQGIYYYKAPLAMAFMGKRVGETVTFRTDTAQDEWQIESIRPAI
jgi:transcription elongation factor GreA